VTQVQLDLLVIPEILDLQVIQVPLEIPVQLETPDQQVIPDQRVILVLWEILVQQVIPDLRETLALLVTQVRLVIPVQPEIQDLLVLPDQQDQQDRLVQLVLIQQFLDRLDLREQLDLPVQQVIQVRQALVQMPFQ
jgi:hypothetical protein